MSDIEFYEMLKAELQLERIMSYPLMRDDYLRILNELDQLIEREQLSDQVSVLPCRF